MAERQCLHWFDRGCRDPDDGVGRPVYGGRIGTRSNFRVSIACGAVRARPEHVLRLNARGRHESGRLLMEERRRFTSTVTPLMSTSRASLRHRGITAHRFESFGEGGWTLSAAWEWVPKMFCFFDTFGRCPLGFWKAIEEVFPGTGAGTSGSQSRQRAEQGRSLGSVDVESRSREVYGARDPRSRPRRRSTCFAQTDPGGAKPVRARCTARGMRPRPTCTTTSSASTISSADTYDRLYQPDMEFERRRGLAAGERQRNRVQSHRGVAQCLGSSKLLPCRKGVR